MPDIGAVLGARYRLVELLGQGGMATVYRARDSQLERDVAIKVLRSEYGTDPDFLARFRHEAQAAASLRHPGIVAVYDYGTDAIGPYIVMELVDGEDLASLLRRRGPLPPTRAAALLAQTARALDAAHQRGLVHRDVKPGNILVTADDRVQVADFGIALALAESAMTVPGTTLGSVHYFSPEQARGEPATPASDIYGLGIVLYELLTGKRPWTGDSAAAVATARLGGAVPSPAAIRPDVPPELDAIDRRALMPDPGDRFSSAKSMAEALEHFVGEERRLSGLAAAGAASAAAVATATASGAGAAALADGAPTLAAGIARPNPNASVPYPPEAFAGMDEQSGRGSVGRRTVTTEEEFDDDDGGGQSRWIWASALLALVILALAGFLVFRFLSATSAPPPTGQVVVPNLIGKTFAEAQALAQAAGLTVEQTAVENSDQPIGTITVQDPIADSSVNPGTPIKVTIAIGAATTIVPDLRAKPEQEALNLIAQAGLQIGARTEAFDLIVPAGAIVSQDPGPGAPVAKNTPVNY
ncbi:MAG TPA: Stk1 family PASTA domain-containing Ser/Thr kinase, partial [Candidatus Limnocylindrales bacterium]|nr:Stk1 family PASTA domain-containing Ser/Thr kinase [Candidatus Limnocylindrales bacterium]